jgi:hypothetical protein
MPRSRRKRDATYTQAAIEIIRKLVGLRRRRGEKSPYAQRATAADVGVTQRRVAALMYENGLPMVREDEFERLRDRAAAVARKEAVRWHMLADSLDAWADEIEQRELQQFEDRDVWRGSHERGRRCAA